MREPQILSFMKFKSKFENLLRKCYLKKWAVYVHRFIVALLRNHCCPISCLYSCLSYPPCKLHLSFVLWYCNLWPVWLHLIYSHYLINGTISRIIIVDHKTYVLFFFTTFVW